MKTLFGLLARVSKLEGRTHAGKILVFYADSQRPGESRDAAMVRQGIMPEEGDTILTVVYEEHQEGERW